MASYGTVVGYFPSRATAEAAISALKSAGFKQNEIGVAARSSSSDSETSPVISDASSAGASSVADAADYGTSNRSTQAGQPAEGLWEKVKNFFEGNDTETSTAQAAKETFADRSRTAYGADDLHSSLDDLSVSLEHSRYFGHRFEGGKEGAIVTVSATGREEEAASILEENGGDLGKAAAEYDYAPDAAGQADTAGRPAGEQNIELYGEVLRVHKERINSGEVRVRKEVHTTTQTIEVPVTREELVIDRSPVAGEQIAHGATFTGEEVRIPLSEERATVDKQTVVREQVRLGKKEVTDVQSYDAQVRSEDLKVDRTSEDPESKVG